MTRLAAMISTIVPPSTFPTTTFTAPNQTVTASPTNTTVNPQDAIEEEDVAMDASDTSICGKDGYQRHLDTDEEDNGTPLVTNRRKRAALTTPSVQTLSQERQQLELTQHLKQSGVPQKPTVPAAPWSLRYTQSQAQALRDAKTKLEEQQHFYQRQEKLHQMEITELRTELQELKALLLSQRGQASTILSPTPPAGQVFVPSTQFIPSTQSSMAQQTATQESFMMPSFVTHTTPASSQTFSFPTTPEFNSLSNGFTTTEYNTQSSGFLTTPDSPGSNPHNTQSAPLPLLPPMSSTPPSSPPPSVATPLPDYTTDILDPKTPLFSFNTLSPGSINVQGGLSSGFFHSLCELAVLTTSVFLGSKRPTLQPTKQILYFFVTPAPFHSVHCGAVRLRSRVEAGWAFSFMTTGTLTS